MNDELKALRKDLLGFDRGRFLRQFVKEYEEQFDGEVRRGSDSVTCAGGWFGTSCFGGDGIRLKGIGMVGWHIRLVHGEEFICSLRYNRGQSNGCLFEDMLVDDITNLQPHEYGVLKLKYGLTKEQLFLPSFLKPFVKDCYYGGGV